MPEWRSTFSGRFGIIRTCPRSEGSGIEPLIADYDLVNLDEAGLSSDAVQSLLLLQGALRLSAHALSQDLRQLPSQLTGRLTGFDITRIQGLLELTHDQRTGAWLRPLTGDLDAPGDAVLRTLVGHTAPVAAVAVTPDGRLAVSGSEDKTLHVWDIENGKELRVLKGHSEEVKGVALTADGCLAVSASTDRTIKVWDVASGRVLRSLSDHNLGINAVAMTPDGRLAVSASNDQTIKVWDVANGTQLRTLIGHKAPVKAVALSESGQIAVSASDDRRLRVWDVTSGAELSSLVAMNNGFSEAVALTSNGKLAFSGSVLTERGFTYLLDVWDVDKARNTHRWSAHTSYILAVALEADGRLAISGSNDGTIMLWNISSLKPTHLERPKALRTLRVHSDAVSALALTPDGRLAISGSHDHTLRILDIAKMLNSPSWHAEATRSATLTGSMPWPSHRMEQRLFLARATGHSRFGTLRPARKGTPCGVIRAQLRRLRCHRMGRWLSPRQLIPC